MKRLKAFRITDFLVAGKILKDEKIAAAIYEDGAFFTVPDVVNEYWVGIKLDEKVIGCYRVHCMGASLWQLHARILPGHRDHSENASKLALKWCVDHILRLDKILCFIPEPHMNVREHAIRVGLKREGCLTASYMKDGRLVDQDLYTISRKEIEKLTPGG